MEIYTKKKVFFHEFYKIKRANTFEMKFWMVSFTYIHRDIFYSVEMKKIISYFLNIKTSKKNYFNLKMLKSL